jgi:zinc transporter
VDLLQPDAPAVLDGLDLDPFVVEALSAEETRPRCETFGDALLVVLRGINTNAGAEPEDMVALRLWVEADRIVSVRRRRVRSASDVRETLDKGMGPETAAALLVSLAERLIERMQDVIDAAEEQAGQLEEQVLTASSRAFASNLGDLRRETVSLRRHLAPQRDAMTRLLSARVTWLGETERVELREVQDRLTRYVEDLDAVRERATVLQQELTARLQDELNRRMYVLSIVAAVFLPLGFLTGLLGVNIGGMPGVESPLAFLVFSLILVVIVGLELVYFRRKGWF